MRDVEDFTFRDIRDLPEPLRRDPCLNCLVVQLLNLIAIEHVS